MDPAMTSGGIRNVPDMQNRELTPWQSVISPSRDCKHSLRRGIKCGGRAHRRRDFDEASVEELAGAFREVLIHDLAAEEVPVEEMRHHLRRLCHRPEKVCFCHLLQ